MLTGELPEKIGPYEIDGILGRGGFGVVYRARDPQLGRSVAIKALLNPEVDAAKFMREGEVLARLQHPNIVIVLNALEWQGQQMIVMELLPGVPLHNWFHAVPPPSLLDRILILEQMATALAYAHSQGVQHRDLKPANVMVLPGGKAKVLDFGIARHRAAAGPTADSSNLLSGTVSYMAPEQLERGQSGLPSDVFSFGVVAYELLSGVHPFQGETEFLVQVAIVKFHPPPLTQRIPDLPLGIQAIITRCLEKEPANRFKDMTEVARLLQRASLPAKQYCARQWVQRAQEALAQGNRSEAERAAGLADALDPSCPALAELYSVLDQPVTGAYSNPPTANNPALSSVSSGFNPAIAAPRRAFPWLLTSLASAAVCAVCIWAAVQWNSRSAAAVEPPPQPIVTVPSPPVTVAQTTPTPPAPKPTAPKPAVTKQNAPAPVLRPLSPGRVRVPGRVQATHLISMTRPVYPPIALRSGVQGTVKFNALIAANGTVLSVEVLSGHPLLVGAATEAVGKWTYRPTIVNGQPMQVETDVEVVFSLKN
jgi:TonB family protein